MDIKDAALMLQIESADHPGVAALAQTVHERLLDGEPVDYRLLNELIGEVSGKGVLRALRARYGPTGQEAILGPILAEIGREAPIKSQRYAKAPDPESDPLLAATWPPR